MKKGGFRHFHTHLWGAPTRKKPTPLPAFRTPLQKHENNPFLHFFEKHPHSRAQTSAATLKIDRKETKMLREKRVFSPIFVGVPTFRYLRTHPINTKLSLSNLEKA